MTGGEIVTDVLAENTLFDPGPITATTLADRFGVPPFSVLDCRAGYWQERKQQWFRAGIAPDEGYGEARVYGDAAATDPVSQKIDAVSGGRSVFDPALAEICYRWFCPPGGRILDPFAGEATKGLVAGRLGYRYTGIELRAEQVVANDNQAQEMGIDAEWVHGDAARIVDDHAAVPGAFDLVFTSPPYFNLETYAGGAADGSGFRTYAEFIAWHNRIMVAAGLRLRPSRFLVTKIATVRGRNAAYHDLVGDTVAGMERAGFAYYNDIVVVTSVATLALRAGRQFEASRKIGKTHQNVLVFWNGDPRRVGDVIRRW